MCEKDYLDYCDFKDEHIGVHFKELDDAISFMQFVLFITNISILLSYKIRKMMKYLH